MQLGNTGASFALPVKLQTCRRKRRAEQSQKKLKTPSMACSSFLCLLPIVWAPTTWSKPVGEFRFMCFFPKPPRTCWGRFKGYAAEVVLHQSGHDPPALPRIRLMFVKYFCKFLTRTDQQSASFKTRFSATTGSILRSDFEFNVSVPSALGRHGPTLEEPNSAP